MLQCFTRETSVLWNMVMLILLLAAPAERKINTVVSCYLSKTVSGVDTKLFSRKMYFHNKDM